MDAVYLLAQNFHTPKSFAIILDHSRVVAELALELASALPHLRLDHQFIEEAALLHDIGVCLTAAHDIDCHGQNHYLRHGIIGAEILQHAGHPLHARVCECHIGVGLTVTDIITQNLPLPHQDMVPESTEEILISLADLYYSKRLDSLRQRKTTRTVRQSLAKFGDHKEIIFDRWLGLFPELPEIFLS
jgi:uncharacterized protein